MYYKVLKNDKVIDVLDQLVYVRWNDKKKRLTLCSINDAQGFLSSDLSTAYHEKSFYEFPIEKFETVQLIRIDEYEYKQLKCLGLKTPEQIIDEFLLLLMEDNVL